MPDRYCFDPAVLEPGVLLPGYRIVGERPETFTLGFRWSAADNMFTNAGLIAIEEWKKLNASVDEQSDERKLRQFVWALPTEDQTESTLTITANGIRRRMGTLPRGVVPVDWNFSGFLDLGKRLCSWAVTSGLDRYQAVDTGVIEVPTGDRTTEDGLRVALWQWYDRVMEGWGSGVGSRESGGKTHSGRENGGLESPPSMGGNVGLESPPSMGGNVGLESPPSMGGNVGLESPPSIGGNVGLKSPPSMGGNVGLESPPSMRRPGIVIVDSGKWTTVVYEFIREVSRMNTGIMWFASKGHGLSQDQGRVYAAPDRRTEAIPYIGDYYHLRLQEEHRIYLLHMDSDTWKSRVHGALMTALGEPGSLVLWSAAPEDTDIWTLSKHLTAEKGIEEFDARRGMVKRWVRTNRNNHFLDCIYGCLVGLDYLRVVQEAAEAALAARGKAGAASGAASGGGGEGPFRWTRE